MSSLGGYGSGTELVAASVLGVVSRRTGINLKSVATTTLLTVPSGQTLIVVAAILRVTTMVGFTTVGASGLGVAAGEDDVFPSVTHTGLDAVAKAWFFAQGGATQKVVTAGQVLKLGIDTGWTATTATGALEVIGYYL